MQELFHKRESCHNDKCILYKDLHLNHATIYSYQWFVLPRVCMDVFGEQVCRDHH